MEVGELIAPGEVYGSLPHLPWRVDVLDHGYVELTDLKPRDGDLIGAVARAARASYTGPVLDDSDPEVIATRSDASLFAYLASHNHVSTLDQPTLEFIVQCPRFVRDQWYRHWSWKYNEVSARYMEMPELYYVPSPEQVRAQSAHNKQGRGDLMTQTDQDWIVNKIRTYCASSFKQYRHFLGKGLPGPGPTPGPGPGKGLARELARTILPHGTYTRFQATVSLRDLTFFLKQRLDPHAQWEIRQYAEAIHRILYSLDPRATELLDNYLIQSVTLPANAASVLAQVLGRVDLGKIPAYNELPKRDRSLVEAWLSRQ